MKILSIVSRSNKPAQELRQELEHLLGRQVQIICHCLEDGIHQPIQGDLVVVGSWQTYFEAQAYIVTGCPLLVARRSLNYHEVEPLLDLPFGTEVLLVNDSLPNALETISLLKALGIDHLQYHPYAPEVRQYPPLQLAVTPGEAQLAPGCVKKVIDIKSRVVDITTMVEILDRLGRLDETANLLSASYVKDVIRLIKRSRMLAHSSRRMHQQLQTILNTVHDGIIAVDAAGKIRVCNPLAEALLGIQAKHCISRTPEPYLQDILSAVPTQPEDGRNEFFFQHQQRHLVVNGAPIQQDGKVAGMVYTFKDVSEIQRLESELRRKVVTCRHVARYSLSQVLGASSAIRNTVALAEKMAVSHSPILLQGESGTGKELLAQGIHNRSPRRKGPFVAVNFAALTESLLESELFGYEEGAFTGAKKGGAAGLFEQAHTGTIFLDEIGDAPLPFQIKLLRVLQEKQIRRVGGERMIPIDVRIIAATNRDLKECILQGEFRQDLYYRLNVLPLAVPPLRQRQEDIMPLACHFYERYFEGKPLIAAQEYFADIVARLLQYDWPGNIRELQNVMEYLCSVSPAEPPQPAILPEELQPLPQIEQQNWQETILRIVATANQNGEAIGRRSLARKLGLPEYTVRLLIDELVQSGQLQSHKGRKGLVVWKQEP